LLLAPATNRRLVMISGRNIVHLLNFSQARTPMEAVACRQGGLAPPSSRESSDEHHPKTRHAKVVIMSGQQPTTCVSRALLKSSSI
jgi:hypothetical protein